MYRGDGAEYWMLPPVYLEAHATPPIWYMGTWTADVSDLLN